MRCCSLPFRRSLVRHFTFCDRWPAGQRRFNVEVRAEHKLAAAASNSSDRTFKPGLQRVGSSVRCSRPCRGRSQRVDACAGANSVLFSKSLTYVVTAPWPAQLADWYSWAVLVAFVATGGYWVHRTAVALRKFPATLIMTLMQARAPPYPRARLCVLPQPPSHRLSDVLCQGTWIASERRAGMTRC